MFVADPYLVLAQANNCFSMRSVYFLKNDVLRQRKSVLLLCPAKESSRSLWIALSELPAFPSVYQRSKSDYIFSERRNVDKMVVIERPKIERVEKVVTITREVNAITSRRIKFIK